jgi:sterol O-acyltransferase
VSTSRPFALSPPAHVRLSTSFTHVGAAKVGASLSKKDGSIILRPIAGRGTLPSQIKSKRGFSSRTSKFDRNNSDSAKDTFRGFYVLFWLMLAVSAAKTGVRNWQEDGTVFGTSFARLITEDGWTLAFSDGIMVVSTFLCVPFAQVSPRRVT